jgi:hypothetical protein
MIVEINCPHCNDKLLIPWSEDTIDVLCAGCKSRFLAGFGQLVNSTWHIEESEKQSNRIYDLRLRRLSQIYPVKFSRPSRNSVLSLMPDDKLLTLHTRDKQRLAFIKSLTAGWDASIIESQMRHEVTVSVIAGLIVLAGCALASNIPQNLISQKYAPWLGGICATPLAVVFFRSSRRQHFIETDETAIAQLSLEQELLKKQRYWESKLAEVGREKHRCIANQERSDKLLKTTQRDGYIVTIDKAKALEQEHESVLQKLIEGYQWSLEQVEAHLLASQLTDSLPNDALLERMGELSLLEK